MKDIAFLGFFAPALLFFQQVRGFLTSILRFFWKSQVIPHVISVPFYKKLNHECKRIELPNWSLGHGYGYVKGESDFFLYKKYSFEIYLYKNFVPLLITSTYSANEFKINYFCLTFPLEKWVDQIKSVKTSNWESNNFYISLIQGRSRKSIFDDGDKSTSPRGMGTESSISNQQTTGEILTPYYLIPNKLSKLFTYRNEDVSAKAPRTIKDKFIYTKQGNDVKNIVHKWTKAEKFYQEKNITYKYSILLYGTPGTGKSTLISEIAKDFNIPVYIFDLSTMDNQEFSQSILNKLPYGPSILLFEDICSIFNERNNITKTETSNGVTFDLFINTLSGVNQVKNKLIFATTNHIEKLDSALLRRFDKKVEMISMDINEKLQYLQKMTQNKELIDELLKAGINDSNAEFEQRVIDAVLNDFWK